MGPISISVLVFAEQCLSQLETLLPTYQRLRLAKTLLRQCQDKDRNWAVVYRAVSLDELEVLQVCLRRWRTEVESDVKGDWRIRCGKLLFLMANSRCCYCFYDRFLLVVDTGAVQAPELTTNTHENINNEPLAVLLYACVYMNLWLLPTAP